MNIMQIELRSHFLQVDYLIGLRTYKKVYLHCWTCQGTDDSLLVPGLKENRPGLILVLGLKENRPGSLILVPGLKENRPASNFSPRTKRASSRHSNFEPRFKILNLGDIFK